MTDLIKAASTLDTIQTELQVQTAGLGDLHDQARLAIGDADMQDSQRLIWWKLQSMTSDALNAAYVSNLIGVGEDQRRFLALQRDLGPIPLTAQQQTFLMDLNGTVSGPTGVFEQRRQELSTIMGAQNALFRIRYDAGVVSTSASNFAIAAEQFLAQERTSSSSTIQLTKLGVIGIAIASLGLALISALYVSRYVTYNMGRISAAMVQLAQGDRSSSLPRKFPEKDEIGDLFRSFRIFRANALRLDRSNRQLDQRNTLFQKVFINISDGVSITDATGRITAQNPAMEAILGLQNGPQIGRSFINQLRSGTFGAAAEAAGITDDHRGYCELESLDGQHVELRASRLPDDGRVWLCADVTEQRRLTDRLQQIDRIEALGKVAGNTAHDFGNILSTIATHAHLLGADETLGTHPSLTAIKNATEYGSSLTQRLLAFAKKQHLAPEVVDLNTLVEGIVDLVEISLKQEVAFEVGFADGPLCVRVDPGQLESALLNLILNANQAITKHGTIRLELSQSANKAASIRITDTGIGMSPDILNRVVEPFFTTRSHDGGTGLGLSIAYGFIRQTGGDLKVSSSVGEGTTIDIALPLAEPTRP
ncbi:MAG: ATP-binding protein, partial [Albidovulum sp.]